MRYVLAALAAVAILATAVFIFKGGESSSSSEEVGITIQGAEAPTTAPAVQASVPTPSSSPTLIVIPQPEKVSVGDRMSIPRIKVEAPLVLLPINDKGEMVAPSKANEVGYYTFPPGLGVGGKIGQPGNAVFSGHVDLTVGGIPQQAVFWDLGRLEKDDEIRITVEGNTYKYAVTASRLAPGSLPQGDEFYWNRIMAATEAETITVITCEGKFNPQTREYDQRRVITAARVK